ncbi:S-adenosyl-L-methionine-dependent methyltransferase [Pseudovirgaria hyperparasitica]|uniref:S-adenosyl-L-methionine-dependent methyltransferase n=1 Tax=Pseudovirgaria hyperparasitica TaxID=470096 RepID=A0A6A6WAR1_9PEZI|nr:S-adenosyl-L-methionine-dependent methyltransferase [Pseudovirgaria hyperparasitica]KAF2758677.1 S-adenosyl-L-methionine-dependent methyltransferase [Pseudovirgaria hyperparasitica]
MDSIQQQNLQTLDALGSQVTQKIAELQRLLDKHDIPQPSFAPNICDNIDQTPDSKLEIIPVKTALVEAARQIYVLALGPREYLNQVTLADKYDAAVMRAILVFEIDKAVPINGEASYAEISKKCDLAEREVKRFVKFAITNYIFYEHRKGYVSHSAVSALWATDADERNWALHNIRDVYLSTISFNDALSRPGFKGSDETNKTPRNILYGDSTDVFQYMSSDTQRWNAFHGAMRASKKFDTFSTSHVTEWSGWKKLPEGASVVDIGGSYGHVSKAIALAHPHLKFCVQDLPSVVSDAHKSLEPELADRISFSAYDFFSGPQPETADVYLLRWVLHDWPDKYAAKILRNTIATMKPGSRILLVDVILPEPNTVPKYKEKSARATDLQMYAFVGAIERDVDMWRELIAKVDSRLEIVDIQRPSLGGHGILEVKLNEGTL